MVYGVSVADSLVSGNCVLYVLYVVSVGDSPVSGNCVLYDWSI